MGEYYVLRRTDGDFLSILRHRRGGEMDVEWVGRLSDATVMQRDPVYQYRLMQTFPDTYPYYVRSPCIT